MDRTQELGQEKISKLLFKFSIPAIVGMVVNSLYNVVDRIFIGQGIGSLGIAGITIGFPIMLVSMAFAMMIGIGATSLISIKLGEQKPKEAELVLGNAVILLIIVSILFAGIGLAFLNPLLHFFGASETVLPYASQYIRIILSGTLFMSIGFGMNNFIRAEGNPRVAMYTMLIGAVLNTILDPIFIFLLDWGIEGAAFATILSQAVSALWVLYYFLSGSSRLRIIKANFKLVPTVVTRIMVIGLPPFTMQIAASVLTVILNNNLSTYGGDVAIAAMGIINTITMLILMPIFGINQGAQPIIGYNYGARQYDRVKEALKLAIIAATIVVTFGFVVTRIFPQQLIMLFNREDQALIDLGTRAVKVFLIGLPIIGFQIVGANYFQAVGKPTQAMILSLSRQVLLLIPLVIILPKFYGLNGLMYAGPVSDIFSSLITGFWLLLEMRYLDNKHCSSNPQPSGAR